MGTPAKHTPGPWHVEETRTDQVRIRVVGPDMDICKREYRRGHPHDEARANAYLIAAAPEMLAALRLARQSLDGVIALDDEDAEPDGHSKATTEAMETIDRTIRKATA